MLRVITLVFFTALFLFCQQVVFACSCGVKPTVLESYETHDLVIITRLVSIDRVRPAKLDDDDDDDSDTMDTDDNDEESSPAGEYFYDGVRSAKMVVEKVYKGNVKVGEELLFAQGGGADCIWTWEEKMIGDKFLFYLDAPTKDHPWSDKENEGDRPLKYYPVTCGRSNVIEGAIDDLSYLNNIKKVGGKSRISGRLYCWHDDAPNLSNIKVRIIGKTRVYETVTNKNGFYEIYDLPAGEYQIEPKVPIGWKIDKFYLSSEREEWNYGAVIRLESKNRVPLTLKAKRHASLNLAFTIDNTIRGKVISPSGRPMKNVCVSAVSAAEKEGDYRGHTECTNDKGEYEIESLSPGNYILVLNNDGKLSGDEPFGIMFYPGVADRKAAGVISMEAGKFINDVNIQVAGIAELVRVAGKVLYSDGTPVPKQTIEFKPAQENIYLETRTTSDVNGNFSLSLPKGASGTILGKMSPYSSAINDCPRLKDADPDNNDVLTNRFETPGDRDFPDIKLIFPVSPCQKENK